MAKSGTKNHEKDQNDFLAVADQGAEGSKPPLETETRSVEIRSQPESLSEKREEREREEKKEGPEKA
ncbi:MAG TPA: hypothetical protein VJB99_04910, partial [Patescibacteria group bacterium]|nr:hypothetical protein [Patescibacteria group bacterium]